MKTFRQIVSEVAEPKAGDEKAFKAKHIVTKVDYPVDADDQFTGGKTARKTPKRKADLEAGEDEKVYEAMDPVNKKAAMGKFKNRKDQDIDNDGDVDSSDKYLHARRKAVTKAIHKEETKLDLSDFSVEEWEEFMESAEYDQLDEISKKTLGSYVKKASSDMANNAYTLGARDPLRKPGDWNKAFKRKAGIAKATDRLTKEEVEGLDEISIELAKKVAKKRDEKGYAFRNKAGIVSGDASKGAMDRARKNWNKADKTKAMIAKRQANEESEQIDELKKSTLASYIKKASGNMAGNAAVGATQASSSMKKMTPGVKRDIFKRAGGIARAADKLAKEEVEINENAWEEVPMMMRQLQFIAYAAEEIMEYLDMSVDPDEWYQNKLAHVHDQMQTLHAYAEGDKRMMSKMDYRMYGEEVEIDEAKMSSDKDLRKTLAMTKNKDQGIAALMKNHGMDKGTARAHMNRLMKKEEVDLDESITKMSHGRLKFHLNTNTPHGSYSNDEMKAERDRRLKAGEGQAYKAAKAGLSEATPTKKAITRALQGMKVQPKDKVSVKKAPWEKNEEVNEVTQSAIKKPVTTTGPDGKTRTVYRSIKSVDRDEHGQEKIKANESVELDEAFKVGMLKLKDGSSMIVKKEEADVLNSLLKSLSSTNRKKMESTAMKNKKGFAEILEFAKEAM